MIFKNGTQRLTIFKFQSTIRHFSPRILKTVTCLKSKKSVQFICANWTDKLQLNLTITFFIPYLN